MRPVLAVEDVGKSFGALRAVDGVSFTVESAQVLGIAGPNGSGKSTLFNLITGIPFAPDRGRVWLDGTQVQGRGAHLVARLGLARTFQRETAFEGLSVRDNAMIGAAYGGRASGAAARRRADEALSFVGLPNALASRQADGLSVYERKLLMLATALAMRPRVLLLDEPASGLTRPEVAGQSMLIRRIAESGVAVVLVEHVLTLLMEVSHRLMVLDAGRVLAAGEPRAVIADERVVTAYLGRRRDDA